MKHSKTDPEEIGKRIRRAREKAGYSQLGLAKQLGFKTATAISLIESGERNITADNLDIIAKVLHCDIDSFFGRESNQLDVKVALRADKELSKEDQEAILHFIELAKKRHGGK
ncbi:MAG: helix-turn-helix domain-containing protein [Candidatus Moranbacteria bacterium]|nr:helix-turn-helix domain-containing protein [Candidatus Moranbacteria bacterium]